MYNVSVGPSKIASKSRRGLNQNQAIDRSESFKRSMSQESGREVNGPRPVFNTRKASNIKNQDLSQRTPEQEEVARFAAGCWNEAAKDLEYHIKNKTTGPDTVMYYEEKTPSKALEDFKPFDFEAWWGRRLYNNITKGVP